MNMVGHINAWAKDIASRYPARVVRKHRQLLEAKVSDDAKRELRKLIDDRPKG